MNEGIPTYSELMLPVLRAIHALGGSGTGREITAAVVEAEGFTDDMLAETYEGRDKSILLDRLDWARSYCKLGAVLESPRRGLFLITDLGREIAALTDSDARERLQELDRAVRRARSKTPKTVDSGSDAEQIDDDPDEDDEEWREVLLARLHHSRPTRSSTSCSIFFARKAWN